MLLYHGSNTAVETPKLISTTRGLDFGTGFYTTSNYEQAVRFTKNVLKRTKIGVRTVSKYEIDENNLLNACSSLRFDKAGENWLEFVSQNRSGTYNGEKYDLITGPVANDAVYNVIDFYLSGAYTKKEALRRLKVRKLFDQWTFCTNKSIEYLNFCGTEVI